MFPYIGLRNIIVAFYCFRSYQLCDVYLDRAFIVGAAVLIPTLIHLSNHTLQALSPLFVHLFYISAAITSA